jgi:hypothetical protein
MVDFEVDCIRINSPLTTEREDLVALFTAQIVELFFDYVVMTISVVANMA